MCRMDAIVAAWHFAFKSGKAVCLLLALELQGTTPEKLHFLAMDALRGTASLAPRPQSRFERHLTEGCEWVGIFWRFVGWSKARASELAGNLASAAKTLDIDIDTSAHENWKLRLPAYCVGCSTERFSAEEICLKIVASMAKTKCGGTTLQAFLP